MTEPVTDEQAAHWAALAEVATEGPWGVMHGDTIATKVEPAGPGSFYFECVIARLDDADYDPTYADQPSERSVESDAEFIAAARTAVPALLAERARLLSALAGRDG